MALADPAGDLPPLQACEAAREAQRLALALGRAADGARAAGWICQHLFRLGRLAEMLAAAPAALAGLPAQGHLPQRRELLRLMSLASSETGAHDRALDCAQELVQLAAGQEDADAALTAAYSLAVCFERMGDSWQATRLLSQALDAHGEAAMPLTHLNGLNALCAISIGVMHRLSGAEAESEVQAVLAQARAVGERTRRLLDTQPNAVYAVVVDGNLGEVMLYQGEMLPAELRLRHALDLARQLQLRAYAWRIEASLAAWSLAAGQPVAALARMEAVIAEAGDELPEQTAIRVHHAAYRACKAQGLWERALSHFEVVEGTERRRATAQLRAQSQLFVTRTEAQHAQWRAEQALQEAQRQSERADEFAERAERDPLTGLGNRRHLARRCGEIFPAAGRDGRPVAVAQLDIDHFKQVNDRHGHAAGDRVLVTLAQVLRENTRGRDVLVRHGGEEFVLVMPGLGIDQASEACERLRLRVAGFDWRAPTGHRLEVTVSIGLAGTPDYEVQSLLQRADDALYRAKRGGRNRIERSPDW
jgi:diguanylate cyclase (GGDEF)-like protein